MVSLAAESDLGTDVHADGPLPGLVWAFQFGPDSSAEELRVDAPIAAEGGGGWLWLHFNLSDARACQFLNSALDLPAPARSLLTCAEEHQQLHGEESCVYGVLADLVCGLDGITEEIGFLHFAVTETMFVSARRHQLNAIEATRRALCHGLKVASPPALLETIAAKIIETLESYEEELGGRLDRVEERILADRIGADRQTVGGVRRMSVRLHRQLSILRLLMQRFERSVEDGHGPKLALEIAKLVQRLDWLDAEIVELRERSRLLQEEIVLKDNEQTNRSLYVLATVTTVFLPANLVAAIFGMNVGGLPLLESTSGFLSAMAIIGIASTLVYWLLKRSGTASR